MTSSLLCCSAGGDALCERGGPPRLPAVRPEPAHRLGAGLPRALVQGQVSPSDTESRDIISAVKRSIGSTITEKAPTRAFSWLKAPTSAFTFKTLLRHYGKQALTIM